MSAPCLQETVDNSVKSTVLSVRGQDSFAITKPMINDIKKLVADVYGTSVARLAKRRRLPDIVLPRHVGLYLCYNHTDSSLPTIARAFGLRDHTTVLYAHRKINEQRQTNVGLNDNLCWIEERLG